MADAELQRKLAFVAPEQRRAVERRIGILEDHLRREESTVADADVAARALGMTTASFYRLARVWKRTRDPARIGAVSGPVGRRGMRPHPGDDFVRETLERLPIDRSLARDVASVSAAAHAAGVEMRPRTSLTRLVQQLRADRSTRSSGLGGAFVDHVALELPVETPVGPVMPIATVLGNHDGPGISAVRLGIEPPTPGVVVAILEEAIERGAHASDDDAVLWIDLGLTPEWIRFGTLLADCGVVRRGDDWETIRGGRTGGELVYPRLLGIQSHPRSVASDFDARRTGTRNASARAVTLAEAQRLVDERLDAMGRAPVPLPLGTDAAIRATRSADA